MRLPGATYFIRNNRFRGGERSGEEEARKRSGGSGGGGGGGDGHFGWPIYIDTDRF